MKIVMRRCWPAMWALSCLLLASCAGGERTARDALEEGPLPYHVGLFLLTATGVKGSEDPGMAKPASELSSPSQKGPARKYASFDSTSPELVERLAMALREDPGVTSKVTALPGTTREAALEAALRLHVDWALFLEFQTPPEYVKYERPGGWVALEVVCWLFGGIPAWFVPSVDYLTESRLSVHAIDVGRTPSPAGKTTAEDTNASRDAGAQQEGGAPASTAGWQGTAESKAGDTSLWDRSYIFDRPLDYLATIFIPPTVLARGDPARLSVELTSDVTGQLGAQLRELVLTNLREADSRASLRAVFVSPDPREAVEAASIHLQLGILSTGGGRMVAMDIHRIASGSPTHRWRATASDLDGLSRKLESQGASGEYVSFSVPEEIPLVPGENVILLRVLREDRELLRRTAVYVR